MSNAPVESCLLCTYNFTQLYHIYLRCKHRCATREEMDYIHHSMIATFTWLINKQSSENHTYPAFAPQQKSLVSANYQYVAIQDQPHTSRVNIDQTDSAFALPSSN